MITQQGRPVTPNIAVVDDYPEPDAPAAGEVQVRVLASALNRMDIWVGMGIPGVDIHYPHIGGCDVCAEVTAVGTGVEPEWIGRRVVLNAATRVADRVHPDDPTAATMTPNWALIGEHFKGCHRERVNLPASNLADVGTGADPNAAAAFGLTTLTAYSMMCTKGSLRPGQTVLITGIGGGVATSALALARWMGCRTIVTSRHQHKLDRARELGADDAILDEGEDWSKQVRSLTNKRGVDMVVDSVGGPLHPICIKSLARGGAFVTPGATAGPRVESDQARIFWNQLRVLGSTMGTNDEMREVAALFRAGHIAPVIDKVFKPDDAPKAWERLEAGEQFGKIVIDWQ